MADTPLGKGLIEIGANLAPLERGLAEAQAKTRRALGGAGVSTSSGASTASTATSIASEATAANQATVAQNNLATSTAKASAQKVELGKSLSNATSGFRAVAGAITGTIGAFTGILGVIGLVAGAINNLREKQEEQRKKTLENRKALEDTRKALEEFNKATDLTAEGILYQPTQLDRDLAALKEFFDTGKKLASEAYQAELTVIRDSKKSNAEKSKAIEDLNERSAQQTEQREKARIEAIAKVEQDSLDRLANQRAATLYENEVRAAQAAGDERKVIDLKAAEEKRKLADQLAKMQEGYDKDILSQRMSIIEAERQAAHKQIDEKEKAEKDAQQKIADEKKRQDEEVARNAERAAKAFADAQRASFSQLQNQINGLFNTGNMEVGINRVASLVQVLIDKTERG
jgi:hypothetical protein